MDEAIRVDLYGLGMKQNRCRELLARIRAKQTELQGSCERLKQMWEGEAARTMNNSLKEDICSLERFCGSLEALCSYQERAGNDYKGAESSVQAEIMRIQG